MESLSFSQIGIFVACVAALVAVALGLKLFFRQDPPLHKEYATKSEIKEAHGRIKRERDEINTAIEARRLETLELRNRLDAQSLQLNEKLDAQTSELNSRIDGIPARTIALLNDTKRLHFGK